MEQIGTTTVKRTTAKARHYIYPYIPLPPQYASLVGSQVEVWRNGDNELALRFGKYCHARDSDSNSELGVANFSLSLYRNAFDFNQAMSSRLSEVGHDGISVESTWGLELPLLPSSQGMDTWG